MTREIESMEMRLVRSRLEVANLETVLRHTLDFLYEPQATYLAAPPALRRQLNQAIFDHIEVFAEGPAVTGQPAEPFKTLLDPMLVQPVDEVGQEADRPAADGTVSWHAGMPSWLRQHPAWKQLHQKPGAPVTSSKGFTKTNLVSPTERQSNRGSYLGLGLKEGVLAPPTGFEPVLPP